MSFYSKRMPSYSNSFTPEENARRNIQLLIQSQENICNYILKVHSRYVDFTILGESNISRIIRDDILQQLVYETMLSLCDTYKTKTPSPREIDAHIAIHRLVATQAHVDKCRRRHIIQQPQQQQMYVSTKIQLKHSSS